MSDSISKRLIQDALIERISNLNAEGEKSIQTARELIRFKRFVDGLTPTDAIEVVRCKDCKHRHEDKCPMYWEEQFDIDEGDGYYDTEYIIHDYTQDEGYCSWGERREP